MESFKKSKLIVAQGKNIMQLESLEELENKIFEEEYKNASQQEKLQQRYEIALPLSIMYKMPIVYSTKGIVNTDKTFDTKTSFSLKNSLVIDDEKTLLLSLCKVDNLRILERKDANIFLSAKDQENMNENKKANYVFINSKANEIMGNYLQSKMQGQLSRE